MNAERPGDRGSSRTPRYDFDRLERSIGSLLEDHERLGAEREALMVELVDGRHQIATLESKLAEEKSRRAAAVEAVDQILDRLEKIEADVMNAAAGTEARGR